MVTHHFFIEKRAAGSYGTDGVTSSKADLTLMCVLFVGWFVCFKKNERELGSLGPGWLEDTLRKQISC